MRSLSRKPIQFGKFIGFEAHAAHTSIGNSTGVWSQKLLFDGNMAQLNVQAIEKPFLYFCPRCERVVVDSSQIPLRMFKKAFDLTHPTPARQDAPLRMRGRSERIGEAYCAPYVELLRDARAKLENCFNILFVSERK